MMYLDLALRGGAITVLFLLALLLWRSPIGLEGRLSAAAISVSKSSLLITQTALPLGLSPLALNNLLLLTALTPAAITWFIVSIFLDGPRWRWPWIAAGLVTSGVFYVDLMSPGSLPLCNTVAVALYGALVGLSLWTARDDLVEHRCRARPAFAAAIAGLAFVLTGAQAIGLLQQGSLLLALLQSSGALIVTVAFAAWLLRPDANLWPGETRASRAPATAMSEADGADTALIGRITAAMSAGIWREEGLTIGALAARLAVPEHRLRRAINHGLGHRNFSSFINRARIDAACDLLRDPAHMHTTMLEIAYDVGFASMGPFNRAFRAEMGCSPTEYRRGVLSEARADSEGSSPIPANLH